MLTLKTVRPRFRVPYKDEEGNVLATFEIEPLSMRDAETILKKHEIIKWEQPDKRSPKQRIVEHNNFAISLEIAEKSIVDWDGITDEDGNKIDCSLQNVRKVFTYNREVIQKVMDTADDMAELERNRSKDLEKNSKNGVSGKAKKK